MDSPETSVKERADEALTKLKDVKNFDYNAKIFLRDLHNFESEDARRRIENTMHTYYLGKPYFSDDTVERILSLPFRASTVERELEALYQAKGDGKSTFCAAHHLAPLPEAAFEMRYLDFKGQTFRKLDKLVPA